MRKPLDLLYRGSGALAAVFLAAICGVVLLQVGANLIDTFADWLTGEPIGLVVPSYAEFAGFFLAAASFLALAYTLRAGGHIRVSLVIQHLSRARRRWIELWCTAAAGALCAYFAFYSIRLVLESIEYGDVSPGMIAVPLWLPQSGIALGLVILTVALVDEFLEVLRGGTPTYLAAERDREGAPERNPSER
ncbi:MAG: TRAP transporter small permease [Gammaproteobacteria bacterium]|nr:TRAP transporter small permease [Gammaproteobacteria bacterium]NIR83060.1 TRAP transporter small permease [Gammaproteobacteria bacterium]NIR90722.1 TRAP transporter small permease [Gammaproteobacteria bacterium]NIU04213.1 TRAP transporter small permease [Gammaproteobacteria bacterium]NIV51505.1 TRAP transporter small permease subunit [Gammaproteobacteria bacterium]